MCGYYQINFSIYFWIFIQIENKDIAMKIRLILITIYTKLFPRQKVKPRRDQFLQMFI